MKRRYETERLILAVLDESHAASVMNFYIRNSAFLTPFEHVKSRAFYTTENHRMTLRLEESQFVNRNMLRLWIFKREDKQLTYPIGTLALSNIIRGAFRSCFLGYKMDEQEINKGYMKEAIDEIVRIAFDEMKLHRIEANIMPRNHRSAKVIEKCGFESEGISKRYLKINGIWEDHCRYVKLNSDDL